MNAAVVELTVTDTVAVVDEQRCIGCTLCIKACPVDAIVGAAKLMHSVITDWCTGCELCVAPCPVDCIAIRPIEARDVHAREKALADARRRHHSHNERIERAREETAARAAAEREESAAMKKRETIRRAVERARQRLTAR